MADGICVGRHIGEVAGSGITLTRDAEDLGYIVVEGDPDGGGADPAGLLDTGVGYEVALGGNAIPGVGNGGASYSLINSGYTLGIASLSAMNGTNGGWAVLYGADPLAGAEIDLAIDEDTLGDSERNHINEQVAYWVLEADPGLPWMESFKITNLGSSWVTVTLANNYTEMVPVCTYQLSSALENEALVRIQNIDNTADTFEVRLQRPRNNPGVTPSDVDCVVVEAGTHTLVDANAALDRQIEAGIIEADQFNENNNWSSTRMENIIYQNSYNAPVVFGQVITYNDPDFSVFWSSNGSQGSPPDPANLYIGKHVGEDPGSTPTEDEILGYLIVEGGSGFAEGYFYEAALGGNAVQGVGDSPPYSYPLSREYSLGVATKEAEDGGQGGWAVLYGPAPFDSAEIDLAIEEEIVAGDTTRTHVPEQVAYWVFEPVIGGTVWTDDDVDGTLDGGELGIGGATVWLCPDTHSMPPTSPPCVSTTTAGDGEYYFQDVVSGNYYFAVPNPTLTQLSTWGGDHDPSTNDQVDDGVPDSTGNFAISQVFSHVETTGSVAFDFGFVEGSSIVEIGGIVWEDTDGDGIQNGVISGLTGVDVALYSSGGLQLEATTTAADGSYFFSPYPPGDYYLNFTPLSGFIFSPDNVGGDDTLDSDPDRSSGNTTVFSLPAGSTDTTWDAGLYPEDARIFDPPSGYKTVSPGAGPVLIWRQVWINDGNTAANPVEITDPIPADSPYIPGSLTCVAEGISTTSVCSYDAVNDQIVWEGSIGPDPGAVDESTAVNEVILTFETTILPNINRVENQASAFWDENGDGGLSSLDANIQNDAPALSDDPATSQPADPTVVIFPQPELPATGFPPGTVPENMISIPPAGFDRQSGLVLEIPSLMVRLPIVGVPYSGAGWETSWLADQAGYLAGSAYPTHAGNTVITAHVWDAYNRPGPFWQLSELSYGEEIRIYGWGKVFHYQVQANLLVGPNQTQKVFQDQDRDVISLLTCENWNPEDVSYSNRRLVRAVLIEVSNDPE